MAKTATPKAPSKDKKVPVRHLEAAGSNIDPDDDVFRPLSANLDRDLSPMKQDRMQKLAVFLWESNGIADRLIELPLAFILGGGVKLTAPDKQAQEILDAFWFDPINRMDLSIEEMARELALFGEQCYPVFVNEYNGHVRVGYVDPAMIAKVEVDPDNARQPIGVITKKDAQGNFKKYRVIMNADENVFGARARRKRKTFTDGDCFFYRIRGLSCGSRGRSDLLPQMDWLDAYDEFMYGELERNGFLRGFIWDVEIKGANEEEIKKRSAQIKVPKAGGARVHNENEVWKANTPDLKSQDTTTSARLFRNHILGGATIPEHWFGGGGDVNRSTAGEMDEPTFKIMAMRQNRLKCILEDMGTFVIWQWAEKHRKNLDPNDKNFWVTCEMPEMVQRDTTKYATALQQVVAACVGMLNAKLGTKEFALRLITEVARRLGVDCDAKQLLDEALKAQAKEKSEDNFTEEDDDDPAGDE